jgi:hypothetical protein
MPNIYKDFLIFKEKIQSYFGGLIKLSKYDIKYGDQNCSEVRTDVDGDDIHDYDVCLLINAVESSERSCWRLWVFHEEQVKELVVKDSHIQFFGEK